MFAGPYGAYAQSASENAPGFFEVVRDARRTQETTCEREQAETRGMVAVVLDAHFANVNGLKRSNTQSAIGSL